MIVGARPVFPMKSVENLSTLTFSSLQKEL
jgi:hypothetical protein